MVRPLTAFVRRWATTLSILLLAVATAVGFYTQHEETVRRASDRAAEIRQVCESGNESKQAIRDVINTIIRLSPPLTADQKKRVDQMNAALAPILAPKNCRTLK